MWSLLGWQSAESHRCKVFKCTSGAYRLRLHTFCGIHILNRFIWHKCKRNPCYFPCSLCLSGVSPLSQTSLWSTFQKLRNSGMLWKTSGAFDTPSGTPSRHTTVQSTPIHFSVYVLCHPSRVSSEYSLWIIPC